MGGVNQSPIIATAGLAAAMLIAAVGWQLGGAMREERSAKTALDFVRPKDTADLPSFEGRDWQEELARLGLISTSTDTGAAVGTTSALHVGDVISDQLLSNYLYLKESGLYTPEKAGEVGATIGANIRISSGYVPRSENDLLTTSDVSELRIRSYGSELRKTLGILATENPPEFETFAYYVETKNPARLTELTEAAERYRRASQQTLAITVPKDGALLHLRAVNALGAYAAALDLLIRYADDSLSTLAVLRTYNEAEREMRYAFDALAEYYVRKSTE